MMEAGARGELTVARIRVAAIVLLSLIPIGAAVRYGAPQDIAGLAVLMVALIVSVIALGLSSARPATSRQRLFTSVFDVTLVSATLALYLLLDKPYLAVNSRVTFLIYFLCIAASALRYDARICVLVGAVAMVEYLAIVVVTTLRWDVHGAAFSAGGYGGFEWSAQVNRVFLMGVATPLSVAVVRRTQTLLAEVHGARQRLSDLSRRLIAAQEDERQRLARELHDEMGQAMTALKLRLQTLGRADGGDQQAQVGECLEIVNDTMSRTRDMALALRPSMLDDLGLESAIRWHAQRMAKVAGFKVEVDVTGAPAPLSPERKTACFRVAQEALTNIARHAGARSVAIEIVVEGEDLSLSVRDDGRGFDLGVGVASGQRRRSLGLLGMRERVRLLGGAFRIISAPGQGTEVRVSLPMTDGGSPPATAAGPAA